MRWDDDYVHALKRSLFEMIELAGRLDINVLSDEKIRRAKELIRCSVQGCGLGGACDGEGTSQYPCPLKAP